MSRAFVKEPDGDDVSIDLPTRSHSDLPNYITAQGLMHLNEKVSALEKQIDELKTHTAIDTKSQLAYVQRDLRYFTERIARAIVVELAKDPDKVRFGVTVTLVDEDDNHYQFSLVGEDETNIDAGRISWASPIARILTDKRVGDEVLWPRAGKELSVEIVDITAVPL